MTDLAAPLQGGCLCGAVQLRVTGAHDTQSGACHCRMCQRWSGGLFLCFNAEAAGVSVTGPVTHYASSKFAERAFCAVCGSHLWMRDLEGTIYNLMPGLFDDTHAWPLRSEVYADHAMAALRLEGTHPRKTAAEYEATNLFVQGETP